MSKSIALLMCFAVAVSGEAMDEHMDEHVHVDGTQHLDEHASACMSLNTPVQAAEKASKQAYAAAATKVTEVGTAADADYTKSIAAAKSMFDATVANAKVQRDAGARAANLKKAEMVGAAKSRASEKTAEEMEKITDLRRAAEQRVVERTHQLMKSIQANHQAVVATEEQDLKTVNKGAMEAAHKKKAGEQNAQLTLTQAAFSDVNTEHKAALEKAFNNYVIGKHQAEIDSKALEETLVARATKVQTDDTKIYEETFLKQNALADSEKAASEAAAKAKKADMLANAQAEVKEAEMSAWVDTMSKEMDHAKLCNGDHLSAAGAAAAAAHIAKEEKKQWGGKFESGNSAIRDMGHDKNAAISLAQHKK